MTHQTRPSIFGDLVRMSGKKTGQFSFNGLLNQSPRARAKDVRQRIR